MRNAIYFLDAYRWGVLGIPGGAPDYLAGDGLDRFNALELTMK